MRQDDVVVAAHPGRDAVVFAVADGVSSAAESHVGATLACREAIRGLLDMLDRGPDDDAWKVIIDRSAWQLVEQATRMLELHKPDPVRAEKLLATTLVLGYVEPGPTGPVVRLAQIGDTGAWKLYGHRYDDLLIAKMAPGQQILSSEVVPLPRVPAKVTPTVHRLAAHDVLLIGTDGFGDPLGDGNGDVGRLFADHLQRPPPPLVLAHLLDFSCETFGDDRTLVAIWYRAQRRSIPR